MVVNENNYGVEYVIVGLGFGGEEIVFGVWFGIFDSEIVGLGFIE